MSEITELFKKLAQHQAKALSPNSEIIPKKLVDVCFDEIKEVYYKSSKENQIQAVKEWAELGLL